MKKTGIKLFALIMALSCALSTAAFAADVRASYYIDRYEIDAVATADDRVAVKISVDGTGRMSALGAEEITLYEKVNGRWMISGYLDRNDSDMIGTNTNAFTSTVYFDGYADTEYKVCVTIFAEDSTGSDSRYKELYVNT